MAFEAVWKREAIVKRCEGDWQACRSRKAPGLCWLCPSRDDRLNLRTWRGRAFLRAAEIEHANMAGRSIPLDLDEPWEVELALEMIQEEKARLQEDRDRKERARLGAARG